MFYVEVQGATSILYKLCEFHHKRTPNIEIVLNNLTVKSKNTLNVLGVMFDSTLSWTQQVSQTISKSKKALHAIKSIRKYFNQK